MWLALAQMSALFQRDKSVISRHIGNIFKDGELARDAVVAKLATTAADGKTYQVEYFNLDVIISVGYRVHSKCGVQFRQWATRILRDHLVKGFTINQSRIAERGVSEMQAAIELLSRTLESRALVTEQGQDVLSIIVRYAKTW
ncbi:MAG: virulence RhuM family protein [Burkholderiales bacterium]|nr:virulence RhuM family protein [Burkholderiales bacterium]